MSAGSVPDLPGLPHADPPAPLPPSPPEALAVPVRPEEALAALRAEGVLAPPPAPQPDAGAPALLGCRLGQYLVLEKIGQGGMGVVFRAQDTTLKRMVAVKVIRCGPLDDAKAAERFRREALCLARLNHPNLLHVYNVGAEGEWHYFAMELLDGLSLFRLLRQRQSVPAEELMGWAGQLLAALAYVHEQGITHRDIKSGNLMICGHRAVLMDFGLAKDEHLSGLTSAGVLLGTPEYMAPEQAEGLAVGPRTDLYSFGVVLYEALTGSVPFQGRSAMAVIRKHLEDAAPSLNLRMPHADPRLAAIIARCLAKDPAARYPDCAHLARDLAQLFPTPELLRLAAQAGQRPANAQETAADWPQADLRDPPTAVAPPSSVSLPTTPDFNPGPTVVRQPDAEQGPRVFGAAPSGQRRSAWRALPPWVFALCGFLGVSGCWLLARQLWPVAEDPPPAVPGLAIRGPGGEALLRVLPSRLDGPDPSRWSYEVERKGKDGRWERTRISHQELLEALGPDRELPFDPPGRSGR